MSLPVQNDPSGPSPLHRRSPFVQTKEFMVGKSLSILHLFQLKSPKRVITEGWRERERDRQIQRDREDRCSFSFLTSMLDRVFIPATFILSLLTC